MEAIKNEILQIIKAFNLDTFQGSRTINPNLFGRIFRNRILDGK